MKLIFTIVLGAVLNAELTEWDMVPPEDYSPMDNSSDLGICYGSNALWSQYPYAVALRYTSGSACCSGSIVSLNPGVIVTAAHCNGCIGAIRVGCNNPSTCSGADQYIIEQFIQHPSYGSPLARSNDVAVVLLSSSITTSGAVAVPITCIEPSLGNVRVTGFGVDEDGSIPSTLKTMLVPEIERTECDAIMEAAIGGGRDAYIDASMVCVRGGEAGQNYVPTLCSGDSGGPMVGNSGFLYGANSWVLSGSAPGCSGCSCCSGYPQVGSNTAYNCNFINGYLNAWKKGYMNYTWHQT